MQIIIAVLYVCWGEMLELSIWLKVALTFPYQMSGGLYLTSSILFSNFLYHLLLLCTDLRVDLQFIYSTQSLDKSITEIILWK